MEIQSDLEILDFVHNDFVLNDDGDLTWRQLLCIELSTSQSRHLSSRLPFNKNDRPKDTTARRWREHVVHTLRKTYHGDPWFVRARALDCKRGTALGTLGYLPREVREEIWDFVLLPEGNLERVIVDYEHKPLTTSSSGSSGLRRFKCNDLWRSSLDSFQIPTKYPYFFQFFQAIFGSALEECLSVFFRRYQFRFSSLHYLNKFLGVFPWEQISSLSVTVVQTHFLHDGEKDYSEWQYTLERLPAYCTLAVEFRYDMASHPVSSTTIEETRKCIDALNKEAMRSFPKAMRSISFHEVEGPFDQLKKKPLVGV